MLRRRLFINWQRRALAFTERPTPRIYKDDPK
jgi:hypothetical protein